MTQEYTGRLLIEEVEIGGRHFAVNIAISRLDELEKMIRKAPFPQPVGGGLFAQWPSQLIEDQCKVVVTEICK